MPYKEQQIINSANNLGRRCGNVVMSERAGSYWREEPVPADNELDRLAGRAERLLSELVESYTVFTYSDNEAAKLVPRAVHVSDVVWQEPIVQQEVTSAEIEARADNAAGKRTASERVMRVAGPVLGFAGVELATNSLIESGIGAVAGIGIAKAVSSMRGYRRRNQFLAAVAQNVKELGQEVQGSESVYLPNKYEAQYLTPAQLEDLKTTSIEISSAQGMSVSAYDVLQWIDSKEFGNLDIAVNFRLSGYERQLKAEGVVIKLNTSLWKLFAEASIRDKWLLFGAVDKKDIKQFITSRERIAQEAGLTLLPSEPVDPTAAPSAISAGENAEIAASTDWLDAECSLVSLPAAQLVRDLLIHSADPNKLWRQIAPELSGMQEQFVQLYRVQKSLKLVHDRATITGVAAKGDLELVANLEQQESNSRQRIFETTLSVAGAAMLQDRQKRYNESREILLDSIGRTSQAEDQWGAMMLFDKGINAVITQLEPDSEEAIQTSKDLVAYLSMTAKYIDGTQAVHDQVYAGMQKRFPQLHLS